MSAATNIDEKIRVLHVDNDPSILEISKHALREMNPNFEFEGASCVDEAFKKLSTGKYDVVVCYYGAAKRNGLLLLKELREAKNTIPFILFTEKSRDEVAIEALNLGADGYFNKQGSPKTVYKELAHGIKRLADQNRLSTTLSVEKERFSQLFNNTPMAVVIYEAVGDGEDFIIRDFNDAAEKIEKIEKNEILGKRVSSVFPGVKKFGIFEVFKRVWSSGKTEYFPAAIYQDDRDVGSWRENWVIKLSNENIAAIYWDISERKRAEERIVQSESHYRLLANNMRDVVWTMDLEGHFTYVSPSVYQLRGYTSEEVMKQSFAEALTPSSAKKVMEGMKAFKVTGAIPSSYFELEQPCKDGSIVLTEVNFSVLYDNDRNPYSILGVSRDITQRKKAEEDIKQKNEILDRVAENIDAGLAVISRDYRVVWANKRLKDLGVSQNKKCYQTFNKLDSVCPDCGVKKVFEENAVLDVHEFETVDKRGEKTWIELRVSPLKDKNENVTAAIELAVPVTERKKAEIKLKESEEKHRNLADSLPDIVFETDISGKLIYANKSAFSITGYTKADFDKGICVFDLIEEKDKKRAVEEFQKIIASKSSTNKEYSFIKKDGSICPTMSSSTPIIVEGKTVGVRGIAIDITQHKKAEEALKESENRLRAIVANAQIGIATSDANSYFLSANEAFCKILGYTEEELRKLTYKDITYPGYLKESHLKMDDLKNGRISSFMIEKRYIKKDGTVIDGKIMVNGVPNENGKPNLFVAELEDTTERKVLERKVKEYSKQLESIIELKTAQLKNANERLVKSERLATIGELAGMVGHDLRNPLAAIKNAAYYLKKREPQISEPQSQEMLEILDRAISHSDKIINDLLDYSRELHLSLAKCSVPSLVNSAIGMVKVPDQIKIVNHVCEESWVSADAEKIKRVFINLIKNAIDAMADEGKLEITSCISTDCVEIAFEDTGTGIPDDILPKLFLPLLTTKAQGMGFGLAICKRIVEVHGGTIKVKTELNKGTTFTVSLPLRMKENVEVEKTWVSLPDRIVTY